MPLQAVMLTLTVHGLCVCAFCIRYASLLATCYSRNAAIDTNATKIKFACMRQYATNFGDTCPLIAHTTPRTLAWLVCVPDIYWAFSLCFSSLRLFDFHHRLWFMKIVLP